VPVQLKRRATNLVHTFLPQVASYNGITDLTGRTATPEQLRAISPDSLDSRIMGTQVILVALNMVLHEVIRLG
jgi:hypothetical protein